MQCEHERPPDYQRLVAIDKVRGDHVQLTFWDGEEETTISIRDTDVQKMLQALRDRGVPR